MVTHRNPVNLRTNEGYGADILAQRQDAVPILEQDNGLLLHLMQQISRLRRPQRR